MPTILHTDILRWCETFTDAPFHALLCDPPYHLTDVHTGGVSIPGKFGERTQAQKVARSEARRKGFMGKQWDGGNIAFQPATWAALAEHLYPGAFLFAFAGTRGYHRMACAMEDAGLIIHSAVGWVTGQGFPKATRIDTQLDSAAGAVREVVGFKDNKGRGENRVYSQYNDDERGDPIIAPATPLARAWAGHRYGLQALKPAFEFIAVAQKPYVGKPVDCITRTGAGAINIDGARIATDESTVRVRGANCGIYNSYGGKGELYGSDGGRWPANLCLSHDPRCTGTCVDGCAVKMLSEQSGELKSGERKPGQGGMGDRGSVVSHSHVNANYFAPDSGTAARFYFNSDWMYERLESSDPVYYQAKASTSEREIGLHRTADQRANTHPTVKPLSLNKWLASLLLPPDIYAPRRLLIPFAGVASECIGGVLAGWEEVVGIEREAAYVDIARQRLDWWTSAKEQTGLTEPDAIRVQMKKRPAQVGFTLEV